MMLKHVQISPLRNRSDSVSLRSSTSSSCASSVCGSPEPISDLQRTPSRASSYSSLNEQLPQTTIKVFTNCLKIDIEYKTLGIQWDTSSKEVIAQLLRRLKMRHRDPRLFYLSMEVCVRRAGVKTVLMLDDDTRPAILQACHPKGESRFCLQLKPGGLIRVHTSALQATSQYKSLVISEETNCDELLSLLLGCYNSIEPVENFSLYEVCPGQEYQRKLHPDDIPLRAQSERMKRGETCHFLVRRNPNYARRRQLLSNSSSSSSSAVLDANSSNCSFEDAQSLLNASIDSISDDLHSILHSDDDDNADANSSSSASSDTSSEGSIDVRRTPAKLALLPVTTATTTSKNIDAVCVKCRNSFKSCEFCHKNSATLATVVSKSLQLTPLAAYNPVYNIREIRTVSHSFSSLGSDKKLLDIHLNARFDAANCRLRPQSVYVGSATPTCTMRLLTDGNANAQVLPLQQDINGNSSSSGSGSNSSEIVNNNPAQGLGHFVYL